MKNIKLDVNLSERNRARLESRSYDSNYTDVPNRALPESLRADLGVMATRFLRIATPSPFVPTKALSNVSTVQQCSALKAMQA